MELSKTYWVYILASSTCTLYIGFTNDPERRVLEHKQGEIEGSTHDYGVNRLVYYEGFGDPYCSHWKREATQRLEAFQEGCIHRIHESAVAGSERGWYS